MIRILKHTGILMMMELGVRFLDAFVSVILARYLSPSGFGLMVFAISFPSIFNILPGFGMGSMVTRDLAHNSEPMSEYFSNGLLAKLFLAGLTVVVVWGLLFGLHFSPEKTTFAILATVLMIFESNITFVLSFFQAAQKMVPVAGVNLGVRLAWVISAFLVILGHGGVFEFLAVRVLITVAAFVSSIILVNWRLKRIQWSFNPRFAWKMLKASVPFALFRIFGNVYTDIDTVMLSSMRGDLMTGWYAAAYKFLRIFAFIPSSFYNAILPALSRFSRESRPQMLNTLRVSVKYLFVISLPIAGLTCILAQPFVLLVYGPKYSGSIPALQILAWSLVLTFLNGVMNASIAAIHEEKRGSSILFYGVLASALSNLIVIPLFGHLGAAATTVLAEGVIFFLQTRLVKKKNPGLKILRQSVKPIVATVVMMLAAYFMRDWFLVFNMPLSLMVYLIGLKILKVVTYEERDAIRSIFQKKLWKNIPEERTDENIRSLRSYKPGITVHCRVRNEEKFVQEALLSVLPLAEKILVYDTGSTDGTLDKIRAIQSDKIEIWEKAPSDPIGIMEYRNEMIEATETEWFFLVDGDEIYPADSISGIQDAMNTVSDSISRIVISRIHFFGGLNFVSLPDRLGRIYRTSSIRFRIYDPEDNRVGHETTCFIPNPKEPMGNFSMELPEDIFFFHCHFLPRSSKDGDLGYLRHWRNPPFPVLPFFGPWPDILNVNELPKKLTFQVFVRWLGLLTQSLGTRIWIFFNPEHKENRGRARPNHRTASPVEELVISKKG